MCYAGTSNVRRFYEHTQLPQRMIVLGDAVVAFNPVGHPDLTRPYGPICLGDCQRLTSFGKCLTQVLSVPVSTRLGFLSTLHIRVALVPDPIREFCAANEGSYAQWCTLSESAVICIESQLHVLMMDCLTLASTSGFHP